MSTDATQPQGGDERRRSQQISLQRDRPPLAVPGYEPEQFLGMGAYGEVWVAIERNTGRRVAVKYYTHRGGLDWSLLSREVEKLAFLFADRHVVQLLHVGWDADPPYYIMEYLEQGSLAERLHEQGALPVAEAVELFRNVAIGLVHAHDKGVLHCDLKPANILLDQDGNPRLADFGQSRLSTEQAPALGTLFYMAPEQAKLTETPDARWDVYALGAVLYTMLTGHPPHWSNQTVRDLDKIDDLKRRLSVYRRFLRRSPPPVEHRRVRGVDRALAEIIDRCLAIDPADRFPDVQAVLAALDARQTRRARRPALLLGAIGPALLLSVVTWFAWQGFSGAMQKSNDALIKGAHLANRADARNLANLAGKDLGIRIRAVEALAESPELRRALVKAVGPDSELAPLLERLSDPTLPEEELEPLRTAFFEDNRIRLALQDVFSAKVTAEVTKQRIGETSGWFLNDVRGVQVARVPAPRKLTIGKNFGWRTYFCGTVDDHEKSWRPGPDDHITQTHLSAVYQSQANDRWIVAISAPVFADSQKKVFLGVVAVMVEVGRFVDFQGDDPHRLAVLVDWRKGRNRGLILQHPAMEELLRRRRHLPEEKLREYRVDLIKQADEAGGRLTGYVDPLSNIPAGRQRWLAESAPVRIEGRPVDRNDCFMVVMQEAYQGRIGSTLANLKTNLLRWGLAALAAIAAIMVGLWWLALRMLGGSTTSRSRPPRPVTASSEPTPSHTPGSSASATPGQPTEAVE
ncbi:MAG: protein kinase [Pirellulales bacterium]|nr:protein kinase [Pirellulales bacterium]